MKVLQINSVINSGSTGRIAEDIGRVLIENGHESYIAFGRNDAKSASHKIKIGNKLGIYFHGLITLLTDRHGSGSYFATRKLVRAIESLNPDVILLHNLHGYYLNISVLFAYLKRINKPVIWTLFDCWAFTGHCSYFDDISCVKWINHCEKCPKKGIYPKSYIDNSKLNFKTKKELFTSIPNLTIITHSEWLANLTRSSFLSQCPIFVTPSATDISVFKPLGKKMVAKAVTNKIILGVANPWSERKGLTDFLSLNAQLDKNNYTIVLIGLNAAQIDKLPKGIIGIKRTENIQELASWYNQAFAFINPTYQDNFPTTNIEALACGTPVITYNTGGSPEAIDEHTGIVVPKGDIPGLKKAIEQLEQMDYDELSKKCRLRAEMLFDKNKRFLDYLHIIEKSV
jgi:putative colanic acid biosynthesis glycosyltransferase